jgi:hypothetical protein
MCVCVCVRERKYMAYDTSGCIVFEHQACLINNAVTSKVKRVVSWTIRLGERRVFIRQMYH